MIPAYIMKQYHDSPDMITSYAFLLIVLDVVVRNEAPFSAKFKQFQ